MEIYSFKCLLEKKSKWKTNKHLSQEAKTQIQKSVKYYKWNPSIYKKANTLWLSEVLFQECKISLAFENHSVWFVILTEKKIGGKHMVISIYEEEALKQKFNTCLWVFLSVNLN